MKRKLPVLFFAIIHRLPDFSISLVVGCGCIIPDASGSNTFFQGCGIDHRLDGRTGLALGTEGTVIAALGNINSPHGCQDIACGRIQTDQCPLQIWGNPFNPFTQYLLRLFLQFQIQGCGHFQSALFDDLRPVPFNQFGPDVGQILRGLSGFNNGRRMRPQGFSLLGRDHVQVNHTIEDNISPTCNVD